MTIIGNGLRHSWQIGRFHHQMTRVRIVLWSILIICRKEEIKKRPRMTDLKVNLILSPLLGKITKK